MKKVPLVLGGIKHCGKSTLGRELAARTGRRFVDSDAFLESLYRERSGEKLGCREIFRREGEAFFRQLEAEAVAQLLQPRPGGNKTVIALGGGVPANPALPENLAWGVKVWLDAPPELVWRRIAAGGVPPFLASGDGSCEERFAIWFAQRHEIYRAWADVRFEVRDEPVANSAARLAEFLEDFS